MRDEFPTDLLIFPLDEQNFFEFEEHNFTAIQPFYPSHANGAENVCPSPPRSWDSHSACSSKPSSPKGAELSSGRSSPHSLGKTGRPINPIPRHKRHSHINAEIRRRSKIQRGFAEIQNLVPAVNENSSSKDSKSGKLCKTAEYCRQLRAECKGREDEATALRQEIQALSTEIHQYQSQLPAAGLRKVERPTCHMDKMLEDYIWRRTYGNWKFWIFSLLVRPLFATYNAMVSTTTGEEFCNSVCNWVEQHCSLVSLRPAVLTVLRQVSTQTSIMTDPSRVPEEAVQKTLERQEGISSL